MYVLHTLGRHVEVVICVDGIVLCMLQDWEEKQLLRLTCEMFFRRRLSKFVFFFFSKLVPFFLFYCVSESSLWSKIKLDKRVKVQEYPHRCLFSG